MKKEMIYTLIAVTVILMACEVKQKPKEMYDSITTTIFSNVYDESGRLKVVSIHQQNETNLDGKYIVTETESMLQQYAYIANDSCKIIEISDQFPQDIYISILGVRSYEYFTIRNSVDTIVYNKISYFDNDKQKPIYNRYFSKQLNVSSDFLENNESCFYYDENGQIIKNIIRDFKTKEATYTYYNVSYKEAMKSLPKCRVGFVSEKTVGDTTVIQYEYDGELVYFLKKYKSKNKGIEVKFDKNADLMERKTTYREGKFDIVVNEISDLDTVDSVFYMNGYEVRRVSIYKDARSTSISEYDSLGNIERTVKTFKSYIPKENLMDEILEELKKKDKGVL